MSAERAIIFHGIDGDKDDQADLYAAQAGRLPLGGWPRVPPDVLAAALGAISLETSGQAVARQYGIFNRDDRAALKARDLQIPAPETRIPERGSILSHSDAQNYWEGYGELRPNHASKIYKELSAAHEARWLDYQSFALLTDHFKNKYGELAQVSTFY